MSKKAITITIEETVINDGKELAKDQNRALSNFIEWLIIKEKREGEKNNKITYTDVD